MSAYTWARGAVVTSASYLTGAAGYIIAPAYTYAIVSPIAQYGLRCAYGAPTSWFGIAAERLAVSTAVSAALPYAPAVGAAVGGVVGMAATAGTIYIAEQLTNTVSHRYQQNCRRNEWRAAAKEEYNDVSEEITEDGWVNFVENQQQPAIAIAV